MGDENKFLDSSSTGLVTFLSLLALLMFLKIKIENGAENMMNVSPLLIG